MTIPPLSLAHFTAAALDLEDFVRCGAASGYEYVDLRISPIAPADADRRTDEFSHERGRAKALLDDLGLRVGDIEVVRLREDSDMASFSDLIAIADEFGARQLKCVSDVGHDRTVDLLGSLGRVVAERNLTLGLEFVSFAAISTLEQAVDVIAEVGDPAIGLVVDALHLARTGGHPSRLREVELPRLLKIELCDAAGPTPTDVAGLRKEARTGRLVPGEGSLPLGELASFAPPDVPVSIEVPTPVPATTLDRAVLHASRCATAARGILTGREWT